MRTRKTNPPSRIGSKNRLLMTFYGDDFTGSTDALEQLTLAGIRTALFIEPPTPEQLLRFPDLEAVGVAGMTRSLTPAAMEKVLRPALKQLKALGARHVHYKVCSTFDSSAKLGSIGRVIDLAAPIFPGPFVPLLVAAPALGRYTVFGTHFARFGIGSAGEVHRLDRHPSISRHPVTPMTEADLRRHLARQTKKTVALFDIIKLGLPEHEAVVEFEKLLATAPGVVLFDALYAEHLPGIGRLLDAHASARQPLFSVGSSGVETALAAAFNSGTRRGGSPAELESKLNLNWNNSVSLIDRPHPDHFPQEREPAKSTSGKPSNAEFHPAWDIFSFSPPVRPKPFGEGGGEKAGCVWLRADVFFTASCRPKVEI